MRVGHPGVGAQICCCSRSTGRCGSPILRFRKVTLNQEMADQGFVLVLVFSRMHSVVDCFLFIREKGEGLGPWEK